MSLSDSFLDQASACAALGSPFMGRLLTLLANHWPSDTKFAQLCTNWPGDISARGVSLPLRITGGLHALVLGGHDQGLIATYPPNHPSDKALINAVLNALTTHQDFLTTWVQSAPQTNEVRRSAALIAAAHWLAARHPLAFVTSELGASAGLNLNWDQYALKTKGQTFGPANPALTLTPKWSGPVPEPQSIKVIERRGVDLNPLDPTDPVQNARLLAYLWPDQPHRVALTRAAIAASTTKVEKGDAVDWLDTRLATPEDNHLHLIYHTVAWQYFPQAAQIRGTALIEAAGAQATAQAPVAWLRMENDGAQDGAALTLRLWPGDLHITLGRVDFHGRWVRWQAG
ncbi:MAG: DUF2332 family protein [Rhodobacteraceae bacterium]|nr:DUF2332 family protein [Paracoccaceae bacterium]